MSTEDHDVAGAVRDVQSRVLAAHESRYVAETGLPPPPLAYPPRLVAVSKYKPLSALKAAYDAGQRAFGENYVQELLGKVPKMPADVAWHFIGHLQSNKAMRLVKGVPNLSVVETVDSEKLAKMLEKACAAVRPVGRGGGERDGGCEGIDGGGGGSGGGAHPPLGVFVQVNTSGEASKSGVPPGDECVALAAFIAGQCPNLRLAGLMTIGAKGDAAGAAFQELVLCRAAVCKAVRGPGGAALDPASLALSMGMSADFEAAIGAGSTNVRVGSTIFGARDDAEIMRARAKEAEAEAQTTADEAEAGAGARAGTEAEAGGVAT
eukprot:g6419.t1